MRVLVDALCAEFGGIRTFADGLLGTWSERFPDDEVHVALRTGSEVPTPGLHRHELEVPRPDVVGRPLVQATRFHRLSAQLRPDVVLGTSAAADVRRPVAPMAVVVYDLRAELRPDQFSRSRRALRWASYGRTYALASGFVSISQRSLDDLHRLHPRTRTRPATVAHLGADHVHDWPEPGRDGPAVAFAHHTNKNPELVVEAWRLLAADGEHRPLLLLGVSGELRTDLARRIEESGLRDVVHLAPYLGDEEFRRAVTDASLIVFPSDFEGFGLPIVEGMAMGKPVVVGPDPGCTEVAGGHAFTAAEFTAESVADAVRRARAATPAQLDDALEWSRGFTWRSCLERTRAALDDLAGAAR